MRILALDIGDVRLGLAMSDPLGIIASPFKVIDIKRENYMKILKEIVEEYEIKEIVFGVPKSLDGTEKRQAEKVREFAEKLEKNFKDISFNEIDERYTSSIAKSSFIEKGYSSKDYRGKLDSVSASLILQTYLELKKNKL